VLKRGSSEVEAAIERNVAEAVEILPTLIADGLSAAQKALHTRD
jgi:hypothetical protein